MSKYRIFYEFMEKPGSSFRNLETSTPWGEGELDGELAYIPETAEEWQNLSREVAKNGNYAAVNVTKILPLEGNFQVTDSNDVIQGEVVID